MTSANTLSRTRWFKRSWFLVTAAIVFAAAITLAVSDAVRFVVCSTAQLLVYGMPQPEDVNETDQLTNLITTVHHFAHNSIAQPDRPPMYSNPGSKMLLTQPSEIGIYGVTDRTEQDKIIEAVKDAMHDRKFKPVDLRFIDHENWIADANSGERGSELQLRRVRISLAGTREEGGEKMITYPLP